MGKKTKNIKAEGTTGTVTLKRAVFAPKEKKSTSKNGDVLSEEFEEYR